MIVDVTSEVITKLKTEITSATILANYPNVATTFPLITVSEINNITHLSTVDSGGERYNDVSLEINIFTDSQTNVTDTKELRIKIDEVLNSTFGMNRVFGEPTPNYIDTSVYRYTLRYNFIIDVNRKIYRR